MQKEIGTYIMDFFHHYVGFCRETKVLWFGINYNQNL